MTRRSVLGMLASVPAYAACRDVSGFEFEEFAAWGYRKCVYKLGPNQGPAVLFLHELPGLVPEAFSLARRLHEANFAVYLPLFFGKPARRALNLCACIGSEFDCRAWHSTGQIVNWVVSYAQSLGARHAKLGVIGNCLTGALPLALMADGRSRRFVKCAVLSQPAIPVLPRSKEAREALGLTDEQIREAVRSRIPVLAFRFTTDNLVPEDRMLALQRHFVDKPFHYEPVAPNPASCAMPDHKYKHNQHSVLTSGYCEEADSGGNKTYRMLEAFLRQHLNAQGESS